MNWNIEPLVGMGPLRLGMDMTEVAAILDGVHLVTARHTAFDGSINEYRGLDLPSCNYIDNKLKGIDTNHRVKNVFFGDIEVYRSKSRDLLSLIEEKNGGAKFNFGMVLFYDVSINTSGFFDPIRGFYPDDYDDIQDERTLGVFAAHMFDPILPEFKDIKIKSFRQR